VRLALQDLAGSLEDLSRAILIDARDPRAYVERALVHERRGHPERAADDARVAISLGC